MALGLEKNESFAEIFEKNSSLLSNHSIFIVVYDVTHRRRAGPVSEMVEIRNNNPWTLDKTTLLYNYGNKASFVKASAEMLQNKGFDVIQCVNDADTTIIKLAPSIAQDFSFTVFSINTDIYSLPIHHMSTSSDINNIYLTNK